MNTAIALKIAYFVHNVAKEDIAPKIARAAFQAANGMFENIHHEYDKKAAVQRALTHLELAYHLVHKHNNKFFSFSRYNLENELCFYIALSHKILGNSHSLIEEWITEKITDDGNIPLDEKCYIYLIGESKYKKWYSEREKRIVERLDDLLESSKNKN